jgi:hypothetical protein
LDWTERRVHLAGRLGSAVLSGLLDLGWLTPRPRGRSLTLTETGASRLATLGIKPTDHAIPDTHRRAGARGAG